MTADQYIVHLRKNSPLVFAATEIKLTPAQLERIVRRSHEIGEAHGKMSKGPIGEVADLFDKMFSK